MDSSNDNSISDDIEGQSENDPNEMNINQELVNSIQQRIQQAMPGVQQLSAFEKLMQQAPQLSQQIASICPELILAFVAAAQAAQQGATVAGQPGSPPQISQQGGMMPPGGNNGATVPTQLPADDDNLQPGGGQPPGQMLPAQGGGIGPGAGGPPPGQLPQPAATTTGNQPPSMPGPQSPLRKQFFTGR